MWICSFRDRYYTAQQIVNILIQLLMIDNMVVSVAKLCGIVLRISAKIYTHGREVMVIQRYFDCNI